MKKKLLLILLWALSVLLAPGHGAAEMQAMPESEMARVSGAGGIDIALDDVSVSLVPKLQLGNAILEALASCAPRCIRWSHRPAKHELRSTGSQAGAWEPAESSSLGTSRTVSKLELGNGATV